MEYYRVLGTLPNPTQDQVLYATCGRSTELGHHEEVIRVHHGEDGPGLEVVQHRAFTIEEQQVPDFQQFQDWYVAEVVNDRMAQWEEDYYEEER